MEEMKMKSIKNLKTMLKLVDHIDYKQDWDINTFTIYTMQSSLITGTTCTS